MQARVLGDIAARRQLPASTQPVACNSLESVKKTHQVESDRDRRGHRRVTFSDPQPI